MWHWTSKVTSLWNIIFKIQGYVFFLVNYTTHREKCIKHKSTLMNYYKANTFMTTFQNKNKIFSVAHKSPICLFLFITPSLYPEVRTSLTFYCFFIAYYFCVPKQWSLILSIFKLQINGSLSCIFFYAFFFYSVLYICESFILLHLAKFLHFQLLLSIPS